jgi:hypothetical protein
MKSDLGFHVSVVTYPIGNLHNKDLLNKNQEHGHDNRLIGSFANTPRSLRCIKAFVATNHADGKPKNDRFDDGGKKIQKLQAGE